ncbi:MAG: hypothetical protein KA174_06620 [Chitinophagales bacterium]|nr:hypothetical protein [Chitinophagales bacterium]
MKEKDKYRFHDFIRDGMIVRGYGAIITLIGMVLITAFLFFTRSCREKNKELNENISKDTSFLKPDNYKPISNSELDSMAKAKLKSF